MIFTTDWSQIRYFMLFIFATGALLASTVATRFVSKQKRQLFRENLLPQQGGKIPETAFRMERLILNRLNQEGLYTNDGIYWEKRRPEVHHHPKLNHQDAIKLTVPPDNRYVAPVGRYHLATPSTVDTSYVIRSPDHSSFVALVPYRSPLVPYTSLKLIQRYLANKKFMRESKWDDIFPDKIFSGQILSEFAPYLKKLHEYDK